MHDLPPPKPQYQMVSKEKAFSLLASIIKVPPKPEPVNYTYAELTCTPQDRANIHELITTMAEHGKLGLLLKQSHLKEIGAKINHVHPLKFLGVVFSDPYLKDCMEDIFDDYFKRNGFMDGLGPSLSRELEKGKLHIYLNDFSSEVGMAPDQIVKYFHSRDWDAFVRFLMKN